MELRRLNWILALGVLSACNSSPSAGCEDLASFPCFTEISPGCCTTEATPNSAICRGDRARCPAGLLEQAACLEFAGEGCEAAAGVPGPGGEIGVCCPVSDFVGCSPGESMPGGGWAPSYAECQYFIGGTGGQPFMVRFEWGCAILREDVDAPACDGTSDAGAGDPDAGAPSDAGEATDAGDASDAGAPPDCSGATRVDDESCTVAGCVPTTAPEGDPPVSPECVAVTPDSCVVSCRRAAPPCPTGTTPEGDGSCYTDRCIPASVCE